MNFKNKITDKQIVKLQRLLRYSAVYEINIQFWTDQTAVYIEKGGVELHSFGGDFDFAIDNSIEYLKRITAKEPKDKTPKQK